MNKADKYYVENLNKILLNGLYDETPRPKYLDGNPAHSKFITGVFEEYDINNGEFPAPTIRNTAVKTGIKEIFWIYQKQTSSLDDAHDFGINWWDSWDIGDNTIGQRYGATIRKYQLIDRLLSGLIDDPFGRRHTINMYQYDDLYTSPGLHPCAYETLWSVRKVGFEYFLDMTLIQRSSDYIVAGHINKTQYVALQMMVAGHCGYKIGKFMHFVQNLHIYDRHVDALKELINRKPLDLQPHFKLGVNKNFYDYTLDDFEFFDFNKAKPLISELELGI